MFVSRLRSVFLENWKFICFSAFLILLISVVFLIKVDSLPEETFAVRFKYLIMFGVIFFGVILSLACNYVFKKNWRFEKIYLALIIPIGLILMAIFPVGRVPDEVFHFARAYGIAHGSLVSDLTDAGAGGSFYSGNVLTAVHWEKDLNYGMYADNFAYFADDGEEVFNVYTNTSQYPFIAYLPQAVGIKVGELFHLPVLGLALFGRLFNFLFIVLLMYFAIKYMPFKKMSVLFAVFMPMMLQEGISLSVDSIINGSAFLLVAYVLRMRYDRTDSINSKDRAVLGVLCLMVSLCKMVYLPICLVLFLIPARMFVTKKRKHLEIGILVCLVALLVGAWTVFAMRYQLRPNDGVNVFGQIENILGSPFGLLKVVVGTITENMYAFFETLVCGPLGWFDIPVDSICTMTMLTIMVVLCVLDNSRQYIENTTKVCMSAVVFLTVLLIFIAEYLTWTPVGATRIAGVQGRYFTPLMLPAFLIVNNKAKYDLKKIYRYLFLIVLFVNMYAMITVFCAHVV